MVGVRLRRLGLSQVAAGRLIGGGHNAFSRYERGEAAPLLAVVNLFRRWTREARYTKPNAMLNKANCPAHRVIAKNGFHDARYD